MLVTELPMVTLVRPLQYEKAQSPMLVTELGMVTLVRPVRLEKALLGIIRTLLPMFRVSKDQQPFSQSEPTVVQLSALKFSVVMPLQYEKAQSPILVTELGMVTLVSLVQP